MNINEWMVEHKLAKNSFAAHYMFSGLELSKLPRFWARVHRVLLYRDWRSSQVFGKATAPCYEKAISGERVPKLTSAPVLDPIIREWDTPEEDKAWADL
jgi:hypothetical protein